METETKQGHSETNRSYESNPSKDNNIKKTIQGQKPRPRKRSDETNASNRCLQNIYPKMKGYTFFSAPHGTFSKTDHIIGHKTGLNRYKNIENVPYILSDHNGLKLIFNNISQHSRGN